MKAIFTHLFIPRHGINKIAFVYTVSGTKTELTRFKHIQGMFYRETEFGEPVLTRAIPSSTTIGDLKGASLRILNLKIDKITGKLVIKQD